MHGYAPRVPGQLHLGDVEEDEVSRLAELDKWGREQAKENLEQSQRPAKSRYPTGSIGNKTLS